MQGNPFDLNPKKGGNLVTIVKADGDDLAHSHGKTAEKAMQFIKKHGNESFLLAVGFVRPYVPFVAPKGYFNPYPYQQIVLRPKVQGDWDDIPASGINYVTTVNAQMSKEQEKKAISAYYASVAYMDAQVGKVLQALDVEGLTDNTIVIFTSDHGFHLEENQVWMKICLHEESVRVPLIIKVPGKAPAVSHSMVELIDLYPTVVELAGLEMPEHIQGKSLVETLDNPHHSPRDMAFSVSLHGGIEALLLRTEKWAYIQYEEDARGGIELFDMQVDPQQYNNLASYPQHQQTVVYFQDRLKAKLKEVRTNGLGLDYGLSYK